MTLKAVLRRDRNVPGILYAYDEDGHVIHSCPVLGRADNATARRAGNPARNPLHPYGDTPTGLWRCRRHGPVRPHATYGVHAVVAMTPVSGDALRASKRSGIWLHGGSPGQLAAWSFLRATFGCLRVADDDMRQIWLLAPIFGEPETIEVIET